MLATVADSRPSFQFHSSTLPPLLLLLPFNPVLLLLMFGLLLLLLLQATPREWLSGGERIVIDGAPTRHGRVSAAITSSIASGGGGTVHVNLTLPASWLHVPAPGALAYVAWPAHLLRSANVDGSWSRCMRLVAATPL